MQKEVGKDSRVCVHVSSLWLYLHSNYVVLHISSEVLYHIISAYTYIFIYTDICITSCARPRFAVAGHYFYVERFGVAGPLPSSLPPSLMRFAYGVRARFGVAGGPQVDCGLQWPSLPPSFPPCLPPCLLPSLPPSVRFGRRFDFKSSCACSAFCI